MSNPSEQIGVIFNAENIYRWPELRLYCQMVFLRDHYCKFLVLSMTFALMSKYIPCPTLAGSMGYARFLSRRFTRELAFAPHGHDSLVVLSQPPIA